MIVKYKINFLTLLNFNHSSTLPLNKLFLLPLRGCRFQIQLLHLNLIYSRRSIEHHIASRIVFRESNIISDCLLASEQRAETVESKGYSTMRRGSVFKGINHKPKLIIGLLL